MLAKDIETFSVKKKAKSVNMLTNDIGIFLKILWWKNTKSLSFKSFSNSIQMEGIRTVGIEENCP